MIDSLRASGELDNTLVMYIVGDNGASAEGGLEGTFSEVASLLGIQLGLESTIKRIDEIGGPTSEPHVPGRLGLGDECSVPVDQAGRQPLRRHAQPDGRSLAQGDQGEGRDSHQFHHVIDVVPTILEACKIPGAEGRQRHSAEADRRRVDALLLRRCEGEGQANDAVLRTGHATGRSITTAGWRAASIGLPWDTGWHAATTFSNAPWELYNVDEDFSQADDLAAKNPGEAQGTARPSSWRKPRSTTCFRSTRGFSERIDPKLRVAGEPKTSWTYFGNNVQLPPTACENSRSNCAT